MYGVPFISLYCQVRTACKQIQLEYSQHHRANEAASTANPVDCMGDGVMGILGIHRCYFSCLTLVGTRWGYLKGWKERVGYVIINYQINVINEITFYMNHSNMCDCIDVV